MSKYMIFIVGKTSSGKDTIANYINKKYGIEAVCSYTTRAKRKFEIDGIQHYFIDDNEMDRIERESEIIAYTKNEDTGIRYCATVDSIHSNIAVYIINPNGIDWFLRNGTNLEFRTIYVELDEDIIMDRALNRGDDVDVFKRRLASERNEFNAFRDSRRYDYLINTDVSRDEMFSKVDIIMKEILDVFKTK